MIADTISIESEDRGFELHITTDEGDSFVFNIHATAEQLYDFVNAKIGPWLNERDAAFAEFRSGISSDPVLQPVLDQIKRTPVAEPCWCWNDPELAPRGLYCQECDDEMHSTRYPGSNVTLAEAFDNIRKMMKENPR